MSEKILTAEELAKEIKKKFKIKDVTVERKAVGLKKKERVEVWVRGNKDILKEFIKYLMELDYPHLAVISGSDLGNTVELIYHFSIYYGRKYQEIAINFSIELPKNDLTVPTICDLIPGALVTEREKQEMLGIKIEGIPALDHPHNEEDHKQDHRYTYKPCNIVIYYSGMIFPQNIIVSLQSPHKSPVYVSCSYVEGILIRNIHTGKERLGLFSPFII